MATVHLFCAAADPGAALLTLAALRDRSALAWPVVVHLEAAEQDGAWLQPYLGDGPGWQCSRFDPAQPSPEPASENWVALCAGIDLPVGWDARLQATADAAPLCAVVSSSIAPLADWQRVDREALAHGQGRVLACEQIAPCALLRPALLAGLTLPDRWLADAARSEFAKQLLAAGHSMGLAEDLRPGWAGDMAPALVPKLPAMAEPGLQDPAAIWPAWYDGRPVLLHVMHGWGGGQQVWVEDFCEADEQHVHLLLAPVGGHASGIFSEIALRMPGQEEPLYRWRFNAPIRATAIHHPEYRAALATLCRVFMVDGILVSSLIGHALDVLDTPLPTLHVCHEYYPFCPAFYIRYQGICQRCDDARLKDCLSNNPASSLFSHVSGASWSAIRRAYLRLIAAKPVRLLAPSESVARYYRQLQPAIAEHGITVIPHGMDWLPAGEVTVTRPAGSLPRIVILGRLYEAKGKALLDELLPRISATAEVVLLGCGYGGKEYAGQPNVILVPSYERTALPSLLAEYHPDLGLLLSIVPETFSYTLSELMHAGIPALAPRLGSFVDRIVDGKNGFLAEPTVEAMSMRLDQLLAERSALAEVAGHLRQYRGSTRAEMVAAYLPLLPSRAMQGGLIPGGRRLPPLAETAPLEAQMSELDAAQCKQAALPRPSQLRGRLVARLSAILIRIVYRLQRMAAGRS